MQLGDYQLYITGTRQEGKKHKLGLQCFCSSPIKSNVCIFKAGFTLLFIFLFAVTANSTLPPSPPVDSAAKHPFYADMILSTEKSTEESAAF